MSAKTSLTIRLETDLHAAFLAACRANDRPAAQVLRAAMRDYVSANSQPSLFQKGKSRA